MGKINILHIIQNSKIGGVQLQLLNLLKAYDKNIINPTVCCLKQKEEVGEEIEKIGVDFISFNVKRHYRFSPKIILELYRLMKRKKIHVVRAHKYSSSLYGRIAAWLAGVPVVITSVHGNYRKDLRFERRIANRILSKLTDRIVAVSESIRKDIIKYDRIEPSKVLVIHNGIDLSKFSPENDYKNIRPEFSITENDIVIGFIGRLVPAKGLEYLIEATAYLKKDFENIKLLIVGSGGLLDTLKDQAKKKGMGSNIIFAGERSDIPDILSCIDIFVMPSLAEGLPNSLLEAMSMAKPTVVTSVGGMPEIINDGVNGLIVPPANSEDLAVAIGTLIKNKQKAEEMGRSARNFVIQNYSIVTTARKWEALYKSLLEKKGVIY